MYRLRINLTYSNVSNANGAVSSINSTLSSLGYTETATRTSATVDLEVLNILTQDSAIALRDALTAAWSANTRNGGKVSLVRIEE